MSVQKLRIKKGQYFVTLLNKVAQGLSYNLELLGLYTYLCSLPPDWEFHKSHIQKECGIGEKKIDKLFNLLISHALIEVIHNRNKEGRFTFSDIIVNDGNSFKNKELIPNRKNRGTETAVRLGRAIKETSTNEIKKTKRASGSPDLKPYPKDFFPDDKRRQLLTDTSKRTNSGENELLIKFEEISIKYKTKSKDWNKTFEDFLIRELPKRTFEDKQGKKRRYDGNSLYP